MADDQLGDRFAGVQAGELREVPLAQAHLVQVLSLYISSPVQTSSVNCIKTICRSPKYSHPIWHPIKVLNESLRSDLIRFKSLKSRSHAVCGKKRRRMR